MAKYKEIVSDNINYTGFNYVDHTGYVSESGIEIIRPVGVNYKGQVIWECKCGYCGKLFHDLPARIKNNHTKSCGCLKTKNKKYSLPKIQYTFYEWCKDNNHDDYLNAWDSDKNEYTPSQVAPKSSKKIWFRCINHNSNHHSEAMMLSHITDPKRNGLLCKQCNSFAQYGIDTYGNDFLDKYWDYDKNTIDPWNIAAKAGIKVWIKCQEKDYHGSYLISCNKFNLDECRCPYCKKNSGKVHPNDSLGTLYPYVLQIWSDKNEKTPYEYAPMTSKKVWFKCLDGHDDYKQAISNAVLRGFRCPSCVKELNISVLQKKVQSYIGEKYAEYTLLHEYNCTDLPINPETKYPLPFDNEIKELKLIIEVHGEQHYEVSFYTKLHAKKLDITPEKVLQKQRWRDDYKKSYIINKGYYYLEIPYWTEHDENYKTLIDEKIKEILHNKTI